VLYCGPDKKFPNIKKDAQVMLAFFKKAKKNNQDLGY
jgi:hypothetical protein